MAGIKDKIQHPESQYFTWPIRVYYEDTDAGGVVYHANYLNFMERARTECLRSLGFEQTDIKDRMGILFMVRGLHIQYKLPAKFNDEVMVYSRLLSIGRCLIEFEQIIVRGDEIITEGRVEVVCIDAEKFKPASIPPEMRRRMPNIKI